MLGIRMREGLDLTGLGGGEEEDDGGARGGGAVGPGLTEHAGPGRAPEHTEPDCAPEHTRPGRTPTRLVPVVARLVADGLLQPDAALRGRAVLTLRGRLMADAVTRALV